MNHCLDFSFELISFQHHRCGGCKDDGFAIGVVYFNGGECQRDNQLSQERESDEEKKGEWGMKLAEIRIESGMLKIRIDAEEMKDIRLLMQAATGVNRPVESFGVIAEKPFAWFNIPFSHMKSTASFDNKGRKK